MIGNECFMISYIYTFAVNSHPLLKQLEGIFRRNKYLPQMLKLGKRLLLAYWFPTEVPEN